ncbi:hypothetical protein K2173_018622 [Erythroxylum novogranatense]|uniref:BZIP domain-containing protein n=1 Tax=Erythroxylum novogranatense TaxID=1862640 RepID=A0AAV8SAT4_9ROSI|nr:hypothetical protein K2173_018622 [Erythroxylum novogranatense]
MAQLPPKIPNMLPTWPDFSHKNIPSSMPAPRATAPNNTKTTSSQNHSWVDEFLDFSSSRRGTHRRSVSDSVAFLEAPMLDDSAAAAPAGTAHNEFDKFDDEQFMSMFTDDISNAMPAPSSSNTSSPSDHNSINEDKEAAPSDQRQQKTKNESDEVQSQCHSELQTPASNNNGSNNDRIIDPKRVKRILANRQSAQRSRVRKLQYISELERSVTSLQAEVSVLSPRVAFLDHQRLLLNVDNSALKQRIAALAQDKIFKDAHQEALKREIERLRQVYHQQSLKKMENSGASPSPLTTNTSTAPNEKKQQQILQV